MKVLLTATVQSHICQFHKPLVEVLHAHGCEVHVAARDNLAEKNGLKLDFVDKVFDVPFSRSPKSSDNLKAKKILEQIITEGGYDIIHCNTPMGGIVTRIAAKKARKNGTKVFYTAHGFHFYEGAPKKNWLIYYPIEKYFSRLTDKLITINTEDYTLAKNKFHSKVFYIHGVGVNENRYAPATAEEKSALRHELGFTQNQKIILCVGELLQNKNQIMAVNAMPIILKQMPNAILLIAGNGAQQQALEQHISELGLSNQIKLLGYCTNLEKYQKAADLLVACSRREGLGLNVIEAMLSENPVVATQNRGHKDLIDSGENGYLVDMDDFEAMAQKVLAIFKDEKLAQEIGKVAHQKALRYCYSAVEEELEIIYFGES